MATKTDSKSVGGKSKGDDKGEGKDKKPKRKAFEYKGDNITTDLINADTKIPNGYNAEEHESLKKKDFEKTADYLFYQAATTKAKGEALVAKAESMMQKAAKVEAMGDEKTAKAMKKAERLTKQLKEARELLLAAGVDLNSLDLG